MNLLNKGLNDLTVKDSLILTAVVTVASFAPVGIYLGLNALREWKEDRKNAKEKEEN